MRAAPYKLSLIVVALGLMTGCVFFPDPSQVGETAYSNDAAWIPPYLEQRRECDCEEPINEDDEALSLAELIDYGLRNHPQTKVSWNAARSEAFIWRSTYNTLYPHVDFLEEIELIKSHFGASSTSASGGGALNTANAVVDTTSAASGGSGGILGGGSSSGGKPVYNQLIISNISINYLMLDFGGRLANIEAARQTLYASNWTHNRTLQTVILTILETYYNFLAAEANYEAQLQNLKDAAANLDSATVMHESGVAPRVDVLQAKAAFVNAELLVEQALNTRETTRGQLATAIGIPADRKIKIAPIPEKLSYVSIENDMDALLQIAKDNRPDLAASYANFLASLQQITIQYSAGMPILGAFGEYERVNNIHQSVNNGYIAFAGITLSGPLFDGFLARNLTKSARANASAAYASYQNAEEQAFLDVVTSYYAYKTAVESIRYSEEYLVYSQEAYDVALDGYRQGVGSILNVLQTSATLANARASVVQSKTQYLSSIASLAYATGTLE